MSGAVTMTDGPLGVPQVAPPKPVRANKFLLGADPEFVFIGEDNLAVPEPRNFFLSSAERQIGQDCGVLVELRPKPAKTAYELVARLKSLLEHPYLEKCLQWRWKAGGTANYNRNYDDPAEVSRPYPITLGGHIHFEAKYFPVEDTLGLGRRVVSREFPASLPLNRLTALLEHLDILPQKESEARSRSGSYGTAYDAVRISAHSYEYRRMCSWLFHPRVSFICLALAKLCLVDIEYMKQALYQKTEFSALKDIVANFASKDDDARRLHEAIFPRGLAACQADPENDFKPYWKRWRPEGVILT